MRQFFLGVAAAVLVAILALLAGVGLGLFPVGADSSPGEIEAGLATRARDSYVGRHAPEPPPIAREPTVEFLAAGAALYEEHCSSCHGGRLLRDDTFGTSFYPPAPQLVAHPPDAPVEELYWIARHGVRYTAMPSFERMLTEEDLWRVAAFLSQLDRLPPELEAEMP